MNREIKFRGYNAKNARWLHGHYFINRGGHYIVTDGIANPFLTHEDFTVRPETVGQFTGLCDCNGNEIYEGDILRGGGNVFVQVEYDAPQFCYKDNDFGYKFLNHPENFEVIGNIHDTPELLEGGRNGSR